MFKACIIAKRALQSASKDEYALIDQDLEILALNVLVIEAKTSKPRDLRKKNHFNTPKRKVFFIKHGRGHGRKTIYIWCHGNERANNKIWFAKGPTLGD